MNFPKLHIYDGRLISLDYDLAIREILEFDDTWHGENSEKERKFELHDKYDDYYWLQEHYQPEICRRTSEKYNTVSHGHVLHCGGQVICKLEDEAQGKDIIEAIATFLAEDIKVLFLDENLIVSKFL